MRIVVLSNKGERADEGQKNLANAFAKELEKRNDILHLNAKRSFKKLSIIHQLRDFRPDIVHIFLKPTFSTLCLAYFCKRILTNVKVVFSAIQPPTKFLDEKKSIIKYLAPDCMMVLTEGMMQYYKNIGINTKLIKCGVDVERFHPVSMSRKELLKEKYGLLNNKPIVMHVGPLTKGRNLHVFNSFDEEKCYSVLIVSNKIFNADTDVVKNLKSSGVTIFHQYIENINEIYQLADLYVFPTIDNRFCIDAPLSVFEAMACNLPVIATKYGVLPEYFKEGDGLYFVNEIQEIPNKIQEVLGERNVMNKTREKISKYTWEYSVVNLIDNYKAIYCEE